MKRERFTFVESSAGLSIKDNQDGVDLMGGAFEVTILRTEDGYTPALRQSIEDLVHKLTD